MQNYFTKKVINFDPVIKVLISLFFLLFFVPNLYAAAYHVDATNGQDSNSGLSEITAWKTIAKVNVSHFTPGDQILFKRGKVWREQLTLPSSGALGNPILIGAYGNGTPPVINGSDQVIGNQSDWTFQGYNVWRRVIGHISPNAVFFDESQVGKNSGILDAKYKWSYEAPYLEVYSVGNPFFYYTSIEVTSRDRALYGWHKNFIIVQDLILTKAQNQGIFNLGGTAWTIINVIVSFNHAEGIRLWGEEILKNIDNATIKDSTAAYNGDVGIYAGNYGAHGTIESNTVHHNCWSEAHDTNAGIKIWGPGLNSFAIRKNTSYGNGIDSGLGRGAGIWVDNTGGRHEIQYNLVHDNYFVGIYIEKATTENITAYNIIYNENATLDFFHGCGIRVSDNVHNQKIINNTIYNCKIGIAVFGTWPPTSNTCNDNEITNNIVYKPSKRVLAAWAGGENDGVFGSGNIYSKNCFGIEFPNFIQWGLENFFSSYDNWQAIYSAAINSIRVDPLFADPFNYNFSLKLNSFCIDSGNYVGQLKDFNGTPVPQGFGFDIGAVEFIGLLAPKNLHIQ